MNFDYYIFLDYSENLIGYNIIEKTKVKELLPRISKLKHYKNLKHKREYIQSMKKLFTRNKIESYLLKNKIRTCKENIEIYTEILEFIKRHENSIIFASIDDHQYPKFQKLVNIVDGEKTKVVKEGNLKKNTNEYKMSLIIDTKLNILRRQQK